MQKNIRSQSLLVYLLVAILVIQSATLVGLLLVAKSFKRDLDKTNTQLSMVMPEVDYQKSLHRPVVMPKEKLVAFPEMGVTLPYNDITKSLQYTYDGDNMRLTSSMLSDHTVRQMGCTDLVRINTKDNSPFNPWEEAIGSVELADGRTIYIIAAKAFKNNEASTEECATEVWTQIKPKQVAEEFKKAQTL
jgi:hypothetical protein